MTGDLRNLLEQNPMPKIVIRVPRPAMSVTEAEEFNRYINTIEKIFIRNGYIVRDRTLLENLMKSESQDYMTIGKKIDTDIIIDILSLRFDVPNQIRSFYSSKTGGTEVFRNNNNFIDCELAKLECRITIVEKGQLGGVFTFYTSRCDSEELWFLLEPVNSLLCWAPHAMDKPVFPSLTVSYSDDDMREYATTILTYSLLSQIKSAILEKSQRAQDLYDRGVYGEAITLLNDLIKKDPSNCDYYMLYGMIHARHNRFPEAEQMLNKAIIYASTQGKKAGVYYAYANYYSLKNEKTLAISFLEKSLKFGMINFKHIHEDEDLANIRDMDAFIELLYKYEHKR